MIKPEIGFLFDIDGTITTYQRNDSVIDLLIINDLEHIRKKGFPIGFVTGRSVQWVHNVFFNNINELLMNYIPAFCEYGLVNFYQGKKQRRRTNPKIREQLLEVKKRVIETILVDRELELYENYLAPNFRSLWVEPKEIMITFRTLQTYGLTIEVLSRYIEPIIEEYEDLKLIKNPYAADILPINISKKTAAEKAIQVLDPENKIHRWFAFGDSETDREMVKAKKTSIEFFKITPGITNEAHNIIEDIMIGKIQ
ncbi:MAG: HAD-IIB family hydrolase [Asgard group archaeon]|nr:HAD-IIB family hydrolase [Asgard group archaeon]